MRNRQRSVGRFALVLSGCLLLGGCLGQGQWGADARFPSGNLAAAARTAALDPQTWVPLATAGLLIAADVDKDWSEDMAERQDFFGDDAEDISHDLRDISTAAYLTLTIKSVSKGAMPTVF